MEQKNLQPCRAQLASVALAYSKAYTSLAIRMATSHIGEAAQPGDGLYGIPNGLNGRATVIAGGIPSSSAIKLWA